MSPSSFSTHMTYLENLAKLHQHYASQRDDGKPPEELISLIRTEILKLGAHRDSLTLDPTLAKTHRLTSLTTALGCNHGSTAAENACVFNDLHALILRRIIHLRDQKFKSGGGKVKAAVRRSKFPRARRSDSSDGETSYSGSYGEESEGGTIYPGRRA